MNSRASGDARRQTDLSCPECGENRVRTRTARHSFRYGAGRDAVTIKAVLPIRHCDACDFEFLDSEGEKKQHEAVCKHLGLMSPAKIRQLRIELRLSRAELARLTGLGEATIARWERGSLIQNAANDRFLKLLAYEENVRRLKKYARRPA
jgi:putative zinc finger/helix-turn-helix YgiT family protein